MAKVIDELLIAIGMEPDEKGFNAIQSGFDQIKSSALALGATLAGGLSLDALIGKTNELSVEWDKLAKETMGFEIDPILLQNLQYMSESLGGSKEDAMALLLNLRQTQQGLQIGNLGYLEELQKVLGGDYDVISLFSGDKSEEEILKSLVALFSDMNSQTRQAAFDVMGFTTGTRNLMQAGVEGYEQIIARSEQLGNITKESTTAAENLQQAYTDAAKASDAAFQNFFKNMMEQSTEALTTITDGLITYRKTTEDIRSFFDEKAQGEDIKKVLEFNQQANFENFSFGEMFDYLGSLVGGDTTNNTTQNKRTNTINNNRVYINGATMSQKEMEEMVYRIMNNAATQTEQDLQVNSQ